MLAENVVIHAGVVECTCWVGPRPGRAIHLWVGRVHFCKMRADLWASWGHIHKPSISCYMLGEQGDANGKKSLNGGGASVFRGDVKRRMTDSREPAMGMHCQAGCLEKTTGVAEGREARRTCRPGYKGDSSEISTEG